jgi:putative ABC transport system permease protein
MSVKATLQRAIDRLGADVLVVPIGARDYAEEVLLETKAKSFYMDKGVLQKVAQVQGVQELTYHVYLTTILAVCCDIPSSKVVAFHQGTDFIVRPWLRQSLGRPLGKDEAILGYEANRNLGLLELESGPAEGGTQLTLFGQRFQVAGVLQKTGTGLDTAIFVTDENLPLFIQKGKSPLKPGEISLIFVRVKPGQDPRKVARRIENAILEVDTIYRNDMGKRVLSTLRDINKVFLLTILLVLALSAFLTWSIFSAIVNERMREVGIMRALGAKNGHVLRAFVLEVLLIGLMGSLLGVLLGTYLSVSFARVFTLLRDVAATLSLAQRAQVALLGLLVGTGLCVLGALSPVLRVRRIEPLLAIKEF